MLPLFVLSIATFWGVVPGVRGLFVSRWFEFFAGVVVFMSWRREFSGLQVAVYLVLLMLAGLLLRLPDDNDIARVTTDTVLIITLLFLLAVQSDGIRRWLDTPLLRYLGNISYSFYLTHALVGIRILKIMLHGNESVAYTTVMYCASLLLSIAAADVIYRLIERPSMDLSHRVRWRTAT